MLSRASRHLGRSSLLDHKLLGDLPRHCGDEELPSDKAVCLSTVGGSLDPLEKHPGPAFQTPELSAFGRCISEGPSAQEIIAGERRRSASLPRLRRSLRYVLGRPKEKQAPITPGLPPARSPRMALY